MIISIPYIFHHSLHHWGKIVLDLLDHTSYYFFMEHLMTTTEALRVLYDYLHEHIRSQLHTHPMHHELALKLALRKAEPFILELEKEEIK